MKKIYLLIGLSLLTSKFSNVVGQETDYVQILLYGQSLALGWESPRAITDVAITNNYMVGSNVNTYYTTGATSLNPLVSTKWASGGQQPIVSCVNAFSKAYRDNINANQKFIAVSPGYGGQTIEKFSKESTNAGYYQSNFIQSLDNTLAAIGTETVSCPAIIYMQGEHNSVAWRAEDKGLTPGTDGTIDKTVYKDLLLTLKNNMQADIMAKYSQGTKPLFFIYQTSGGYIAYKDMPVVMAQIEFAEENDDVVLLNPHYALPDYSNGHLSTNGYRWYGELMSKSLVEELVNDNTAETLRPTNFEIDNQKIIIDYYIPVPPLVLDTWTTPMQSNYGFVVYKDGSEVSISSVAIVDDKIEITCATDLLGEIEIVYAGNTTNGSGNLRDSDNIISMYTYFDDSIDSLQESYTPTTESGGSIYGEPYGMQNWSNMFYYNLGNYREPIDPDNIDNSANHALNKYTSQSSVDHSGASSRAVDGNTSGVYSNNSVTHTIAGEENPSWEVDLGANFLINEIVVYGRTDACCSSRLSNFTVSVLKGGNSVFSEQITSVPNPSITVDLSAVEGNIVKIQLSGTEALSLAEVQVYGEFSSLLSVSDSSLSQIQIFQNPENDSFRIKNAQGATIKVFDTLGRLIINNEIENDNQDIDMSYYKKGMYFVNINFYGRLTTKKIIKK